MMLYARLEAWSEGQAATKLVTRVITRSRLEVCTVSADLQLEQFYSSIYL